MSREHTQSTATKAQTVLDQIERVIRWSGEFRLAFVKCNSPLQQEEMRRMLLARLHDKRILEISLQKPIVSLLDELTARWDTTQPPDAVCVYGLEKSISEQREASPVLGRLNHDRGLLRRVVPAALLIWLPDFALDCVARGAPDFWAWRSGVYEFPTEAGLWQRDSISALAYEVPALFSLSLEDKQKEIARLEELLRAARALPRLGKREQGTISRLSYQLGTLYASIGRWDVARSQFEQSLEIDQRLDDQQGIATSLQGLGALAAKQERLEEAERWYRQSLAIAERLGDTQVQAVAFHQLGNVSLLQGQVEEAKRWYQQSLAVEEQMGNEEGRAITFYQLGMIAWGQGQIEEARQWYQESLVIFNRLGNEHGRALTFHALGRLAEDLGNIEEAIRLFQQAEAIFARLGNPRDLDMVHASLQRVQQPARKELTETNGQELQPKLDEKPQ
jgi:Tfp pilus assembly protein PilF